MDKSTKKIIRYIASVQLEAISFLRKEGINQEIDKDFILKFIEAPNEKEWKSSLDKLEEIYTQLKSVPTTFKLLNEYQLLVCSHILYRMEDTWSLDNQYGVFMTWSLIHQSMKKFHPEFKILLV
jgi:hypothetical protein|nr:MAG TPA: hypothetical protein [Caudoviricetes sp.]